MEKKAGLDRKSGGLLTGSASLTIDVDQMTPNFPEGPHPVPFATEAIHPGYGGVLELHELDKQVVLGI